MRDAYIILSAISVKLSQVAAMPQVNLTSLQKCNLINCQIRRIITYYISLLY